jgi:hypothetical protein
MSYRVLGHLTRLLTYSIYLVGWLLSLSIKMRMLRCRRSLGVSDSLTLRLLMNIYSRLSRNVMRGKLIMGWWVWSLDWRIRLRGLRSNRRKGRRKLGRCYWLRKTSMLGNPICMNSTTETLSLSNTCIEKCSWQVIRRMNRNRWLGRSRRRISWFFKLSWNWKIWGCCC